MDADITSSEPTDLLSEKNEQTPDMGGGLPIIGYWAKHTLAPEGAKLWQTLLHKSAFYLVFRTITCGSTTR